MEKEEKRLSEELPHLKSAEKSILAVVRSSPSSFHLELAVAALFKIQDLASNIEEHLRKFREQRFRDQMK